jgi:hypothetical protein
MITARSLIGAVLLASCVAGTAAAQEAQGESAPANTEATEAAGPVGSDWVFGGVGNDWVFGGEAYFWGPSMGGTSAEGDDIDIPFSDILDSLNYGLMGLFVARKNKLSLFADAIYLDLETTDHTTANIIGVPISIDADVELQGVIATAGAGYAVLETDNTRLDALGGARYLWLKTDITFDVGPAEKKFSDSGHVVDGVIGLRGKTDLNENWFLSYYLDVGTGQSDYTFQAWGSINHRFERFDLAVGYRYLEWNFDDHDALDDLNIHGPMIGAKFAF